MRVNRLSTTAFHWWVRCGFFCFIPVDWCVFFFRGGREFFLVIVPWNPCSFLWWLSVERTSTPILGKASPRVEMDVPPGSFLRSRSFVSRLVNVPWSLTTGRLDCATTGHPALVESPGASTCCSLALLVLLISRCVTAVVSHRGGVFIVQVVGGVVRQQFEAFSFFSEVVFKCYQKSECY
jgi:hypothetical protein